jgi:hypothetical protein
MVLPPEERLNFFVYIIESPSAPDLYHRRSEGELIEKSLSLHNIPCVTRLVISREAFEASIKVGLAEEMKNFPELLPILHISAHGGALGLQLSNGEEISWADLRSLLLPVSKALDGGLLLCMSSCEGFSACRMAMQSKSNEYPFFAVIGNTKKPTWSDTAIAYATFYHLIAKGEYVTQAVEAMQVAAGDYNFINITATAAQQAYLDVINKVDAVDARAELQQEADKEPPSSMAKKLENSK